MGEGAQTVVLGASSVAWAGAAVGALIGLLEWIFLPRMMETSIRGSREGRRLSTEQLNGVVTWWKTVIRIFAVSMPVLGFGLAAAMAE